MGSGSSHCNRCQQDVDSYGNVQVIHQDYCDLKYQERTTGGIHALQRIIQTRGRSIDDLYNSNWNLKREIIRLKDQNEDFRKANKDLARKNQSLQLAIARERKVMYQSHEDLRKQATDLKSDMNVRIGAYKTELDQAHEKMMLDEEKIKNQRNQLRNMNQRQEQFIRR